MTDATPHEKAIVSSAFIITDLRERLAASQAEAADLRRQMVELTEALTDAAAHLAGATSAYEKFVGRHNRRGCRDAFFETRYRDFVNATERARDVCRAALALDAGGGS